MLGIDYLYLFVLIQSLLSYLLIRYSMQSLGQASVNKKTLFKQTIAKQKSDIIKLYPGYQQKINALALHEQLIITSPKSFVNLFQSNELNSEQNKLKQLQVWTCIADFVINLFKLMPINSTFIFKQVSFVVHIVGSDFLTGYRNVNSIEYIIIKIFQFLEEHNTIIVNQSNAEEQEKKKLTIIKNKIMQVVDRLCNMYHYFMQNCCVHVKTLKLITQILCSKFYSEQLTVSMLQISYKMFSELNDPLTIQSGNLQPFLYFDGSSNIGINMLTSDNKWLLDKGMHLCIWMTSLVEEQNEKNYIFTMKVNEKNSFSLRQERSEIIIDSLVGGEKHKRNICDIPIRELIKLEIALQPKGLFIASTQYKFHMRLNGKQFKNVEIKMPKFHETDLMIQFSMFGSLVGQLYSVAIFKSYHSLQVLKNIIPDRLQRQFDVNKFLQDSNNLSQDLFAIFSPLRTYKNFLINIINSKKNHAQHYATIIQQQSSNQLNKYLTSFAQILLPYLYFTVKLWRDAKDFKISSSSKKISQIEKFVNTLLKQYCKSRIKYTEQMKKDKKLAKVKNSILENYKLTILFVLYWLQNGLYPINEQTLMNLLRLTLTTDSNYQPLFYRYIDKSILASKEIKHQKVMKKLNLKKQIYEFCNPVTKQQLMFYLQTTWRQLWNKFQYMTEWWEPINLKMQSDNVFDHTKYLICNKIKIEEQKNNGQFYKFKHPFIQWTVSQFITNDFCDCLIVPIILDPTYRKLGEGENKNAKPSPFIFRNFEQLYRKKQCMSENFVESDLIQTVVDKEENQTYVFQKIIPSLIMGLLMNRTAKSFNQTKIISQDTSPKKKSSKNLQQFSKSSKFQTNASYLNLLTLIIGTLTIQVRGNSAYIYFSQKHDSTELDHMCSKFYKNQQFVYIGIDLGDVRVIKRRRFNLSMNGMEIRLKSGHGYLFYFHEKNIDKFIAFLKQSTKNAKNRIDTVFKDPYDEYLTSNHTILWIDKKISNWEYLQWLNDIAGRSYSDITQYPVLPWVYIQTDKSPQTNLSNASSFRDFTKNMGSFGPKDRVKHFLDKYENVDEQQLFSGYHFGTHYSSSAIIFNYLIRLRPFSVGAVTLQSGRFDCADRVFSSYIGSWSNATNSPTDLRELIPQIYLLPEMMININGYDFGFTQLNDRICNVQLPNWCNHNPYVFCKYLRKALQSVYVNQKIAHWIDLIYGYKQQGPAAIQSMNLFFPLTYQFSINLDKINDPEYKRSLETQIAHFGQSPAQIIGSSPHSLKSTIKQKWQQKLLADGKQIKIQEFTLNNVSIGQTKFIYQSVFQDQNSILSVQFMTDTVFVVLRRQQFYLFEILENKKGFISKQKEVDFILQNSNISLDYQNITNYVPMVTIINKSSLFYEETQRIGITEVGNLAIVGGFYNGCLQIIYLNQIKTSGTMKMPFSTVTALAYSQQYKYLYIGDSEGRLGVYGLNLKNQFSSSSKELQLTQKFHQQIHDLKINSININKSANLFITCSQDGSIKLFNLYSQQQYRKIMNPSKSPIIFAKISTCPLYCIVFYSQQNCTMYCYSINGQFLSAFEVPSGFIYNMSVIMATDHSEYLTFLNAQRQIFILQLPQLKIKKKIKLKKDQHKISCFQITNQIAIAGKQDGTLKIIADPSSF